MDKTREKIQELSKQPGKDLKAASLYLGKSHAYLHKFINQQSPRKLHTEDVAKLATFFDVDISELGISRDLVGSMISSDYAMVPVYDVKVSAGGGAIIEQENVLYHAPFNRNWLSRVSNGSPEEVGIITVDGDSMEPTLHHGDDIIVDCSVRHFRSDGIYVLRYNDTLLAKRLRFNPANQSVTIISDNPLYPPLEVPSADDLTIVGKVVKIWKTV